MAAVTVAPQLKLAIGVAPRLVMVFLYAGVVCFPQVHKGKQARRTVRRRSAACQWRSGSARDLNADRIPRFANATQSANVTESTSPQITTVQSFAKLTVADGHCIPVKHLFCLVHFPCRKTQPLTEHRRTVVIVPEIMTADGVVFVSRPYFWNEGYTGGDGVPVFSSPHRHSTVPTAVVAVGHHLLPRFCVVPPRRK
jgi:hypothetical protein